MCRPAVLDAADRRTSRSGGMPPTPDTDDSSLYPDNCSFRERCPQRSDRRWPQTGTTAQSPSRPIRSRRRDAGQDSSTPRLRQRKAGVPGAASAMRSPARHPSALPRSARTWSAPADCSAQRCPCHHPARWRRLHLAKTVLTGAALAVTVPARWARKSSWPPSAFPKTQKKPNVSLPTLSGRSPLSRAACWSSMPSTAKQRPTSQRSAACRSACAPRTPRPRRPELVLHTLTVSRPASPGATWHAGLDPAAPAMARKPSCRSRVSWTAGLMITPTGTAHCVFAASDRSRAPARLRACSRSAGNHHGHEPSGRWLTPVIGASQLADVPEGPSNEAARP